MPAGNFYVYILASASRVLDVGVTNNLSHRCSEHRLRQGSEFTRRYQVHRLVWYERFGFANDALAAEKRIKGWSRAKKLALIATMNSEWEELMPEA